MTTKDWLRRLLPFGKRASDGFCVLPFKNLYAMADGQVRPCCAFTGTIQDDGGRPMSLMTDSADAVWNSRYMRRIRRSMAKGKPLAECSYCHLQESRGLVSVRQTINEAWAAGWTNPELKTPGELMKTAAKGVDLPLETVEIALGPACNLKCRMCFSDLSSAIAADPVHSAWAPPQSSPFSGLAERPSWALRKERLFEDLLRNPERLRNVSLAGGETLLVPETREIMRHMIDSGAAPQTTLTIFTNATVVTEEWCELAARFKLMMISVSLEGHGAVQEYIRFPSRWDAVEAGLRRLQALPNAVIAVNTVAQAYNMLSLVELARFCETLGIPWRPNAIKEPAHLSSFVMPTTVRRGAARRLRDYVVGREVVGRAEMLALADAWEAAPEADPELLRQFMIFTNDLDASRGQSFAAALPELAQMLNAAGTPWTDETRFAARVSA